MKTPIQELIEKINNEEFDNLDDCKMFIQEYILEKEKVLLIKTHGNKKVYDSQIDPTIVTGEEWYNKTFNTKER